MSGVDASHNVWVSFQGGDEVGKFDVARMVMRTESDLPALRARVQQARRAH